MKLFKVVELFHEILRAITTDVSLLSSFKLKFTGLHSYFQAYLAKPQNSWNVTKMNGFTTSSSAR